MRDLTYRRLVMAAAAAALLLSITGCASLIESMRGPQRQMIYATGKGEATAKDLAKGRHAPSARDLPRRPGPDFPKWGTETIDISTSVAISPEATSHVEAVALARQAAHDKVFQSLAAQVVALPAPKAKDTVGNLLKARANDRTQVEKLIRSAEFTHDAENESGSFESIARLKLEPIALLLYGEAAPTKENGESDTEMSIPRHARSVEVPTDPLQRKAFDTALANARRDMLRRLKGATLLPSYTVADLMKADDESKKRVTVALDYALVNVHLDDIRNPHPGVCEVDLSLDATPILDNLKSSAR